MCYTPAEIRAAYDVTGVAPLRAGKTNYGQGQTIVLVDAYGSPTMASDLQFFHDTFFSSLPNPDFDQVYPNGAPNYGNYKSSGQSGPSAAAGWAPERPNSTWNGRTRSHRWTTSCCSRCRRRRPRECRESPT